jgi:uncharacterized protein
MHEIKDIIATDACIEIDADERDLPIIERALHTHTKSDLAIRSLQIPEGPLWLNIVVRLIRFYQRNLAHRLGNRCVFDPSCSHYSEMAFRKKGFIKGLKLTIRRLLRCRPGNGGVDIIK